jgi:hypothetical protein
VSKSRDTETPDLFAPPQASAAGENKKCTVLITGPDGTRLENFTMDWPDDYRYASLPPRKMAEELRVRAAGWFRTEDV